MPILYDPNDATNAWPDGVYRASLESVEDGFSKKGAAMQTWGVRVYHADGRDQLIKDYVTFPACTWKLGQFASALGKSHEFKERQFQADDCINSSFDVELIIEESMQFGDKNKVGRYVKAEKTGGTTPLQAALKIPSEPKPVKPVPAPAHTPIAEDDIPF